MDRVFLDANVLVSAALRPQSRLADLWSLPDVRLLGSPYVLMEARRNAVEPDSAARLERLIEMLVILPSEPANRDIPGNPRLPDKDRPVLLAAMASGAGFLLTGDITHFGACLGKEVGGVRVMLPGAYLRGR
jgi:predicted nucleic acid-binding protein